MEYCDWESKELRCCHKYFRSSFFGYSIYSMTDLAAADHPVNYNISGYAPLTVIIKSKQQTNPPYQSPAHQTDCLYISFTFPLKHTFAFDPLGLEQPHCNAFDRQRGTTRSKERRELSSFDEYRLPSRHPSPLIRSKLSLSTEATASFRGHAQRSRIPTPILLIVFPATDNP